jgi:hypothetical protein
MRVAITRGNERRGYRIEERSQTAAARDTSCETGLIWRFLRTSQGSELRDMGERGTRFVASAHLVENV